MSRGSVRPAARSCFSRQKPKCHSSCAFSGSCSVRLERAAAERVESLRAIDRLADVEQVVGRDLRDPDSETIGQQRQQTSLVPDFQVEPRPQCRLNLPFEIDPVGTLGSIDDEHDLRTGIGAAVGGSVLPRQMSDDGVAAVARLHFDEVRGLSGRLHADVGVRTRRAKPVFAIDADGLCGEAVARDVLEATEIAAELLEQQAQLAGVGGRAGHQRDASFCSDASDGAGAGATARCRRPVPHNRRRSRYR